MSRRGIVLFSLMSVIWGIPYLLIRIAVEEVPPAVVVFGRTSIAAVILLPFVIANGDARRALAHWRWVVAFAVIEMAIPWVLIADAERHVTSSVAALLIAGVPLVGVILAVLGSTGERVGRVGMVGLGIGFLGVLTIVGLDIGTTGLIPVLELAIVTVCYAVGPAILVRHLPGQSWISVSALSLTLTAIVYAPFAVTGWPSTPVSMEAIGSIVALGVICTALAFVIFSWLIAEIGAVRATVITYVNPAVATVLGVMILAEPLTAGLAVGFALVLVGSALATRPARPSPTPPTGAIAEA